MRKLIVILLYAARATFCICPIYLQAIILKPVVPSYRYLCFVFLLALFFRFEKRFSIFKSLFAISILLDLFTPEINSTSADTILCNRFLLPLGGIQFTSAHSPECGLHASWKSWLEQERYSIHSIDIMSSLLYVFSFLHIPQLISIMQWATHQYMDMATLLAKCENVYSAEVSFTINY